MKAADLANFIINKYVMNNREIANVDVHKIIYEINLRYLSATGRFLIDDSFESWQFGPCVAEVFNKFSHLAIIRHAQPDESLLGCRDRGNEIIGVEELEIIRRALDECVNKTPQELGNQARGMAWNTTINSLGVRGVIEDRLIVTESDKYGGKNYDEQRVAATRTDVRGVNDTNRAGV